MTGVMVDKLNQPKSQTEYKAYMRVNDKFLGTDQRYDYKFKTDDNGNFSFAIEGKHEISYFFIFRKAGHKDNIIYNGGAGADLGNLGTLIDSL